VRVRDVDRDLDCEWTIVEATKADPSAGSLSEASPSAVALVGHVEGDVVEVQAPAGVRRLKVVAISARVGEGRQQPGS
jgi:transcription elongation GreA/GreB family factor